MKKNLFLIVVLSIANLALGQHSSLFKKINAKKEEKRPEWYKAMPPLVNTIGKNENFDKPERIDVYDFEFSEDDIYRVYTIAYNTSNRIQSLRYESPDGVFGERIMYSYTSSGEIQTEVIEYWDGVSWQFDGRFTYEYTPEGYIEIERYEEYVNSSWEIVYMYNYEYYGGSPSLPENFVVRYSEDGVEFKNDFRFVYSYKDGKPESLEALFYDEDFLIWQPFERWKVVEWGANIFRPDMFNYEVWNYDNFTNFIIGKENGFVVFPDEFHVFSDYDMFTDKWESEFLLKSVYENGKRVRINYILLVDEELLPYSRIIIENDDCFGYAGYYSQIFSATEGYELTYLERWRGETESLNEGCFVSAYDYYTFYDDEEVQVYRYEITHKETLSIAHDEVLPSIHLYPNPVRSNFSLELDTYNVLDIYTTSIDGKKVIIPYTKQKTTDQTVLIFDSSNLNSGTYFILLNTDKGTLQTRFVK